jgi:antitoxin (DNA-binding transcriptional repressor) of toxin-antitoxin stability system
MAMEVDVQKLPAHWPELLARLRAGEEVTLAEHGEPIAQIVPVGPAPSRRTGYGMFKGQLWIADDFDAPLPEEELREWEK